MSKLLAVIYISVMGASLLLFSINGKQKTKPKVLIALYLLICFVLELVTTFLLPRGMANHFVYAFGFLFQIVLLNLFVSCYVKKMAALISWVCFLIYVRFFFVNRLWEPATILQVKMLASIYFYFAVSALFCLWCLLKNNAAVKNKFAVYTAAVFTIFYTLFIINISVVFNFSNLPNKTVYIYFYKLYDVLNFLFYSLLSWQVAFTSIQIIPAKNHE
jgi:hypothetical protein